MRETVDTLLYKDFDKAKTTTIRNIAAALQTGLNEVKNVYLEEEVKNHITYLKTVKHQKASYPNVT